MQVWELYLRSAKVCGCCCVCACCPCEEAAAGPEGCCSKLCVKKIRGEAYVFAKDLQGNWLLPTPQDNLSRRNLIAPQRTQWLLRHLPACGSCKKNLTI